MSGAIARHIADTFELQAVGAVRSARRHACRGRARRRCRRSRRSFVRSRRRATSLRDPAGLVVIAIQLGGAPIGSLAIIDAGLSDTVLHSIANLAAIGLERARSQEATARAEAAQQSSELRATVLDALAHEFKTPLTSMKAAASDLLASASTSARDRELVAIIDEELDRFQALVTDAVQMLRIDAGNFTRASRPPQARRCRRRDVAEVRAASRWSPTRRRRFPRDLTVDADRELLALALRQLLDNALKYSPPTSTIEIRARGNGAVDDRGPQFRFDDSGTRAGAGCRALLPRRHRRATFREPGWASPSFSRSRGRTAGR